MSICFAKELELYGPKAPRPPRLSVAEGRHYCRQLARRHYENFTVASLLLPPPLRQHFYHIYAYCRWADDLADETGDPAQSLALLEWWEAQLDACYRGETTHPVFLALAETIQEFSIPPAPFRDLLVAFRQDQRVTRYETREQLLEYCRYSANPVGRLVLYLGRCCNPEQMPWSDAICTGLQLANFWQDVARDFARGRVYLPLADCQQFGFDVARLAERPCPPEFRRLLAAEVADAEGWLRRGLPLVAHVPRSLRWDISLFIHGGLTILEAIRRQNYDVLSSRPVVSKFQKLALVARCWWNPLRDVPREDPR